MTKKEKVIKGLEHCCLDNEGYPSCKGCPYGPCNVRCGGDLHADALALLKEHEKATIEPKRIDLTGETKVWLDKMDAVDALGNIADICMDWDGYRTVNGLGGLINEIWAYARYCADRLQKTQEPIEVRLHLCDSCTKLYPECDATADGIEFGCGVGNDNIIGCTAYENRWKAQEPVEPKKVNRYFDFDDEGHPYNPETYDCGACGKELPWKANYCPECGQKVKWE